MWYAYETPTIWEAMTHMDDKTNLTPEQTDMQTGEEVSFTITGEDAEAQEALNAKKPEKKKSPLPWIIGAAAVVAAVVLIFALKPTGTPAEPAPDSDTTISEPAQDPEKTPDETQPDESDSQTGEEADGEQTEPAGNGVSYTISAEEMTEDVLDREIAVCGDDRLTNRELPFYYWQQYYTLISNYGSYASYFIDGSTPFDQQTCVFDDSLTWQQYFLQAAILNYENVAAVWKSSVLAGFTLSEEDQAYLDELGSQITLAAANYGFESADAYLQEAYGPAATLTAYREFVERQMCASAYLQKLVDEKEYTEADISKYFDDNAETYAGSGIEKSDVKMVNVRHILIQPENANDDGTYPDEAWAEAEKKAEALLAEWKNGEHTEDSFAFLAAENSADPGSATNGGLYEDVYPGQMVDEFDAWCFDASRQPGDTGIVKTSYGYHIMYFCSTGEHPYWYACAESDYLNQLSADTLQSLVASYAITDNEQNAAIVDIMQTNTQE